MGTKSKQGKKQSHPSMSYEAQVAIAVQRALQGEIQRFSESHARQSEDNLRADLKLTLYGFDLSIQTLVNLVLEKFDLSREQYDDRMLSLEDKNDGYELAEREAGEGDRVRFTIQDTLTEGSKQDAMMLSNLSAAKCQLVGDIDKEFVGMKAGETKLIKVTLGDETKKDFAFEVSMKRVSAKVKKDEPKQEVAQVEADGQTSADQTSSS